MLVPVGFLILALVIVRTIPGLIDKPPPNTASLDVSELRRYSFFFFFFFFEGLYFLENKVPQKKILSILCSLGRFTYSLK